MSTPKKTRHRTQAGRSIQTGPRDVFLQLIVIIFLYATVISVGILLFRYIDIAFPDALRGGYGRSARSALRMPVAVLTIVFPLYIWFNIILQNERVNHPEKNELKTRKWLIAFTLFLTALAIVSDLVSLIYHFLSGGLTVRFVLKVIAILLIACSVFLYYAWNFRRATPPSKHPLMRWLVRFVVALGGMAIIAGYVLSGSPFEERRVQFDERRIADLQSLQWEIVRSYQEKQQLPSSLSELEDDIRGYLPPRDPRTGDPYEYRRTNDRSFELCAVFETSSDDSRSMVGMREPLEPGAIREHWRHDDSRTCFERTIDPDRYPPVTPPRPRL